MAETTAKLPRNQRLAANRIAGRASFTHGHSGYANYMCRCSWCRAGRAEYMRARRARGRAERLRAEAAGQTYVVSGVKHGRNAYIHHSCRCEVCVTDRKAYRDGRRNDAD